MEYLLNMRIFQFRSPEVANHFDLGKLAPKNNHKWIEDLNSRNKGKNI